MDQEWKRTSSGLFIPAEHSARLEQAASIEERRHRNLATRFASLQTWATILALVISATGLWLGYEAFGDQQSVNRAQQEITAEQQKKESRRYADKVNWWIEYSHEYNSTIHIENRSLVPISPIIVVNHPGPSFELVNDRDSLVTLLGTPPCTAVLVEVPPNAEVFGSSFSSLLFRDPVGTWIKDGVQAEAYTQDGYGMEGRNFSDTQAGFFVKGAYVSSVPIKPLPLSDCGESA